MRLNNDSGAEKIEYPKQESDKDIFKTFETWLEVSHHISPLLLRPELKQWGIRLARDRKQALKQLIKTNPARALALGIPSPTLSTLPDYLQTHMEEWVSSEGAYHVSIACGDEWPSDSTQIYRTFSDGSQSFQAFVGSKHQYWSSMEHVKVKGLAVDEILAISQLKKLSPGTISMKSQTLSMAGSSGGVMTNAEPLLNLPSLHTQGIKRLLFMPVCFPDDTTPPMSKSEATKMLLEANEIISSQSYQSTSLVFDITPLLMLPAMKATYGSKSILEWVDDVHEASRASGFDPDLYDLEIIRNNKIPGKRFAFDGLATIGGKGLILQSSSLSVAVHELGHNFGLWHANFWDAEEDSIIGPGRVMEYGDVFDTMGSSHAAPSRYDFNMAFKQQLHWISQPHVLPVIKSGFYRLHAFDTGARTHGRIYGLRIHKDQARDYWLSFRSQIKSNPWTQSGLIVQWAPFDGVAGNSLGGTMLLDSNPGRGYASNPKHDAPLVIGRTFSDAMAGIHITPVSVSHTKEGDYLDTQINIGDFSGNQSPTLLLIASEQIMDVGQSIDLSVEASDPDRDPLTYHWTFGDGTFEGNTSSIRKFWDSPGHYPVRCEVSDMKGGKASKNLLCTVGDATSWLITGRITANGIPLSDVRVLGQNEQKQITECFTDSYGIYFLCGLETGTYTLNAVRYGYKLEPSNFNSTITIDDSLEELNWVSTPLPRVFFEDATAEMKEDSTKPKPIRLRLHNVSNNSVTIQLELGGTAVLGEDYVCSQLVSHSKAQEITIPGETDGVDLWIQPLTDQYAEGIETIVLSIMPGASYQGTYPGETTIQLLDNSPPDLPQLEIDMLDAFCSEEGNNPAQIRVTRHPVTDLPLAVKWSSHGTASDGVDFHSLPEPWIIPENHGEVIIPVIPLDDDIVEKKELVRINLEPQPTYTLTELHSVEFAIHDDDPTALSIVAVTDQINEGSASTAFMITRHGFLGSEIEISYELLGDAVSGADYQPLPQPLTMPANSRSLALECRIKNDHQTEGLESISIALNNGSNYHVIHPGIATTHIHDNDLAQIQITPSAWTTVESSQDPIFVQLNIPNPATESIQCWFTLSGTASRNADYKLQNSKLENGRHFVEIAKGSDTASLTMILLDDMIRETTEIITLAFEAHDTSGYQMESDGIIQIQLNDDDSDQLPGISFTAAQSRIHESSFLANVTVQTSAPAPYGGIEYTYEFMVGTASHPGDYVYDPPSIRWIPKSLTADDFTICGIVNDSKAEEDETILIKLVPLQGCVLDNNNPVHVFTIIDDDSNPEHISISNLVNELVEGSPRQPVFRIQRTGHTNHPVNLFLQYTGKACSPSDVDGFVPFLTLPAGDRFIDIQLHAKPDLVIEGDELFTIHLVSASEGQISNKTASIHLKDNKQTPPVIWFPKNQWIYGELLGNDQLNASSHIAGKFAYTPTFGTIMQVGETQRLSLTFTPYDLETYNEIHLETKVSIYPRDLFISALGLEKTYGESMLFDRTIPSEHVEVLGLVAGDSVQTVSLQSLGASADAPVSADPYSIHISNASGTGLHNYSVTYKDSVLIVHPAPLTPKFNIHPSPSLVGELVMVRWDAGTIPDDVPAPSGEVGVSFAPHKPMIQILSNGRCEWNLTALPAGNYSVTFSYPGDNNFSGSTNIWNSTHTVNTPPKAEPDDLDGFLSDEMSWDLDQLLKNDFDPDDHPLTLSLPENHTAHHATVWIENHILWYARPEIDSLTDNFRYVLTDAFGATSEAEVNIHKWAESYVPPRMTLRLLKLQESYILFYHGEPEQICVVECTQLIAEPKWRILCQWQMDHLGRGITRLSLPAMQQAYLRVIQ